jgi:hypothetical protein
MGLYPSSTDIALCAAPGVSVIQPITAEVGTPVRLATDTFGNIYATDPGAGGVLVYNSAGNYLGKIKTSKSGSGVAITQKDPSALPNVLLVTQGDYIARINSSNGSLLGTFGKGYLQYANGITVNPTTGDVFVTDGRANTIQKYTTASNYGAAPTVSTMAMLQPAGIQFEKTYNTNLGLLYVANSLVGNVLLVDPANITAATPLGTIGTAGYGNLKFTYPQDIAFEYDKLGTTLVRTYVSDAYQGNIQILDGAGLTKTWSKTIAGNSYGSGGKLFVPAGALLDQYSYNNRRLFVANGGGNLAVFGVDNLQPTNIQVANLALADPNITTGLKVSWANPVFTSTGFVRVYRSTIPNDNPVSPVFTSANPVTVTEYTDSGLAPGTMYYYTVRAIDNSDTATEFRSAEEFGTTRKNYNLALTTTATAPAGGFINGLASCGANSGSASCLTNAVLDNTSITLTAAPTASTSVFGGWTGWCDPAANNPGVLVNADQCTFTMTAAATVGATFTQQTKQFKVDGNYFADFQGASDAAGSGSTIKIMATGATPWPANSLTGIMTGNNANPVKLEGGYDAQFTATSGAVSVISGRVNVKSGKISIISPVKVKP